jgi:CRP-like cAMP-binding protein
MISSELLRYYPYFAGVENETLKEVAEISEEKTVPAGQTLFKEGETAKDLLILTRGHVDVLLELGSGKQVKVDAIVPGDILSWSALIEPHRLRATAIAKEESSLISIDATKLRALCDSDHLLGYRLMQQIANALSHRLGGAVTQIAASG